MNFEGNTFLCKDVYKEKKCSINISASLAVSSVGEDAQAPYSPAVTPRALRIVGRTPSRRPRLSLCIAMCLCTWCRLTNYLLRLKAIFSPMNPRQNHLFQSKVAPEKLKVISSRVEFVSLQIGPGLSDLEMVAHETWLRAEKAAEERGGALTRREKC